MYCFVFKVSSKKYADLFSPLLESNAQKHSLKFQSVLENNEFCFFVDGDNVLDFANDLSEILPLSLNFNFVEIKELECDLKLKNKSNKSPKIPNAKNIESKKFFNTKSSLDSITKTLKDNKSVVIKTTRGVLEFSTQKLESSLVMFCDLSSVQTYMRVDLMQINMLASFEKPSMNLIPKEVFKELFLDSGVEIECVVAWDSFLVNLAKKLRENEIEFLFFKTSKKTPESSYDLAYKVESKRLITSSNDGLFIDNALSKENKFNIIKHHYQGADFNNTDSKLSADSMLVFYLSSRYDTSIWAYDSKSFKEILPICFNANPSEVLNILESNYKDADKLLANFKKEFGKDSLTFEYEPSVESKNITDFFGLIARVLGHAPKNATNLAAKAILLNNAKLYLRDKGPRIDYKLIKDENNILNLDYPRILRSTLSFCLAEVEKETISFGVLDSFAEFLGGFALDMQQNYSINNVFIFGDLLTNKIFLDKILHYLPKSMFLILPESGYIDIK